MRVVLFKKVVIKSITLLFSVLVWGQPALGCDGLQWDRTYDLRSEIEKVYGDFDNDLIPTLFKGESTPLSVVSLHLDPHRANHEPAELDGSQSLQRLRSVRAR
jgi:hypothetical protein